MSDNILKLATTAITGIVTIVVGSSLMIEAGAKVKPEQLHDID